MKNRFLKIAGSMLVLALLSACNLQVNEGKEEIEALEAANNALKKDLDAKEKLIEQLKQDVSSNQAEVLAMEKRIIDMENAGPPMPPPATYIYDAAIVSTTGEQMLLRDVTYGDTERELPTRMDEGRVLFGFASIDTFQRIGQPLSLEERGEKDWMPATLITTDYQEVKVNARLHHLAGTQPNGLRIEVPIEEINAMRLKRRLAPPPKE